MVDVTRLAGAVRPRTLIAGSVLGISAAVAAAETFKLPSDSSAPGLMVLQKHGRAHVSRRPGDGPTVVFENGLGVPLTAWSWVAQSMPEDVPFFCYDRPGIGWSHAAPESWRRDYPAVLVDLLRLMNVHPPLVLVGHSVGGLLVRTFADQFPDLVGGLVFVDPSPPGQYERPRAVEGLNRQRDTLSRLSMRSLLHLPLPSSWTSPMLRLPDPMGVKSVRAMSRYSALRAVRRETDLSASDWATAAARLTTTPNPVAVVTSGAVRREDPDYAGFADEFAALSDVSHSDVIEDADHMSVLCDRGYAVRVADAIRWAVDKCPQPPAEDTAAHLTLTEATS